MVKQLLRASLFFIMAVMLTGCGKLKTEKTAVKWANKSYDIKTEVLESKEVDNGMQFKMQSEDGIIFDLISEVREWGLEENNLGEVENTQSDYYKKVIEYYKQDIEKIEKEYGIQFILGNRGVITSVYKKNQDLKNPEKDLADISNAISDLAEIIKPTSAYDFNHGNRIYLVENLDTSEHVEFCFEFNQEEAGKVVNREKEFFKKNNRTYPQIKADAKKWATSKHPDYYGFQFSFYLPKAIALIQCCPEPGVISQQYFVDVKQYNELYKEKDGKITEEDFVNCIME